MCANSNVVFQISAMTSHVTFSMLGDRSRGGVGHRRLNLLASFRFCCAAKCSQLWDLRPGRPSMRKDSDFLMAVPSGVSECGLGTHIATPPWSPLPVSGLESLWQDTKCCSLEERELERCCRRGLLLCLGSKRGLGVELRERSLPELLRSFFFSLSLPLSLPLGVGPEDVFLIGWDLDKLNCVNLWGSSNSQ